MDRMMLQTSERIETQAVHPVLEALQDGVCAVDGGWRVTYWNAAAERMLGVRRERVLRRGLWERFRRLRDSESARFLRTVHSERLPQRWVERLPRSGRMLAVHAAPLPDGGVMVQFHDATEELRRAERTGALLESIRDGFLAVDERWSIVYLNGVAESLLRFPQERALGVSLWSLLPDGPSEMGESLRASMADGIQRHLREVRPEGRAFHGRVFDLWIYPLAGGGISVLFEDVSDRVQRERELARLAAEASEANQAKSRFFAAVSHELRTPLNAILGYNYLLETAAYGPMPESARRAAQRTAVCAEHLSRLVDDVLLMTTAEIGRLPLSPSPLRLQEFLPSVVEPHRHQAEAKGLQFGLRFEPGLPPVETDPERLRQLLGALLSNAIKFTGRGSVRIEVALRAAGGAPDSGRGEYSLFPDTLVEIAVADTGPGVADEERERIFGPFEQLGDPARSHTIARGPGLGLAVARKLAGLLHGSLWLAESSPEGSRFCLNLPMTCAPR